MLEELGTDIREKLEERKRKKVFIVHLIQAIWRRRIRFEVMTSIIKEHNRVEYSVVQHDKLQYLSIQYPLMA